jgi:hypothetical protein
LAPLWLEFHAPWVSGFGRHASRSALILLDFSTYEKPR